MFGLSSVDLRFRLTVADPEPGTFCKEVALTGPLQSCLSDSLYNQTNVSHKRGPGPPAPPDPPMA